MIPIERQALDILKEYNGINDYILDLKKDYLKGKLTITRNQSIYVIRHHQVQPKIVKKVVEIYRPCQVFIQEQLKLEFRPEKIYIDKLLSRKDDILQIWGCFGDNCDNHQVIFIPKECVKKTKEVPVLDFSKYEREPKPHQITAITELLRHEKFILADDMGLGKFLDNETLIYTPLGTKKIGEIIIGDEVIGSNGKACKVIGVFPQGKKETYKITFNDGYSILAGDEHLWSVSSPNYGKNTKNERRKKSLILSTKQMYEGGKIKVNGEGYNKHKDYEIETYYKSPNGNNKWQIPIVEPIQFENNYELPIDPYLLGLSLGDGSYTKNGIRFSQHKDDYDELFRNFNLTEYKSEENKRSGYIKIDNLLVELELYDKRSHNKFIPNIYKYTSIENRLAILQGLMDTDGHCMKSKNGNFCGTEFSTISEKLCDDVCEIVQTLGGIARKKSRKSFYKKNGEKIECNISYRVNIKLPLGMNPFRLKRKAVGYIEPKKYPTGRYITNIEKYSESECTCISVDAPDKLYVAEHAIVTHNTTSAIIAAMEAKFKKILVVCPASLKLNWKKEIMNYDIENNISIIDSVDFRANKWTIINYDILKNFHDLPTRSVKSDDETSPIDFHKFDLVIADECFPYKTLVDTNIGKLEIGYIVENNLDVDVLSYNLNTGFLEYKKINRWIKKETNALLKISLQNGLFIECTPNHKIYVNNKGYTRADEISKEDELLILQQPINEKTNLERREVLFEELLINPLEDKSELVEKNGRKWFKENKTTNRKELPVLQREIPIKKQKKSFLQQYLFSKMENVSTKYKRKNIYGRGKEKNKFIKYRELQKQQGTGYKIFGENENIKPYVYIRNSGEDARFIKRSNVFGTWWERKNNNSRTENERCFGFELGVTLSNKNTYGKNKIQIVTPSISSRFRERDLKNCDRDRWENASNKKMEIFGQKENRSVGRIGVESIEVLESGGGQSTRRLCEGDKRVYNIEVIDNNNYFADNILVSNCHYLKNSTSNRTKIFNDFASRIPNRWLLTGTPITNKPIDFYNLLKICESPIASNWVHFVRRYCAGKQINRKGSKQKFWLTSGASNLDELKDYSSEVMLRRTKKDSIDLPQKTIKPIYLPITYCTGYNDYIREYELWIEEMEAAGEKPTMSDHLTKLIKVRQLLSHDKIDHTIKLAEDLIENGHKVIIFSCFTQTINTIHEHFGKTSVIIDGSVSKEKRNLAVEKFQNDEKIKVFCGNIVAAGVGLTLTEGSIVIFNDLDWTPANHAQAEDRAHRMGQVNDVHIIYPLFDETLDIMMFDTLRKKMKIINQVMGDEMLEDDLSMGKEIVGRLMKH